jgi:hypothetical protein
LENWTKPGANDFQNSIVIGTMSTNDMAINCLKMMSCLVKPNSESQPILNQNGGSPSNKRFKGKTGWLSRLAHKEFPKRAIREFDGYVDLRITRISATVNPEIINPRMTRISANYFG